MTLLLDNAEVVAAADMRSIIDALERALTIDATSVPRVNLPVGENGFFRVGPVVIEALDVMGLKAFNSGAGGTVRYLIALWRVSSGELLALLDASTLTAIRTGAVTGVAQRALAHEQREVGVIGSGLEARTNLEAICAVAPIRRVRVYSPRPQRRETFAREMSERLGVDVVPVDSPQAAIAQTVLVATNTGAGTGVVALEAAWLDGAEHVNTIGSTMPSLREVDGATFGRAELVVLDTLDAPAESGDLQAAAREGHWDERKVRSLADVLTDAPRVAGMTVFKSVGTGLQDVVAAKAVYEEALERGLGRSVEFVSGKVFA
ncbi:MAG TPA: ornithine cyclodeaminase family protein [Solirubrobacter sp.]|nr:ornithine cyclodeaminase family protein [Solirubrobacter sp.]